ncbi:MAG: class I SAM-dependent methyltransferase [Flavobacteriales bacterium]|nr:class I SAM-dependent methyltransferase [Flavobacteriales bacterium]
MKISSEIEQESITCIICGSSDSELLAKKGRNDVSLNFRICKGCGLGYLSPRWTKQAYNQYYATEYDKHYRKDVFDLQSILEQAKKNVVVERFQNSNFLNSEPLSVLEIGSGEGRNLAGFKNVSSENNLYAIEPSVQSHKILEGFGVEVISNDVDDDWHLKYPKKFDVIIMRHVLEHFLNPIEVLNNLGKVLKEDGVLYIAVPNCFKATNNVQSSWIRVVHTFYFNPISFKNLIDKTPFKISELHEGDQHNNNELFAFLELNTETTNSNHNNCFEKQKEVFMQGMSNDAKPLNKVKRAITKIMNK